MSCTRNDIVEQMQSWIGRNEADGSHKAIIDLYNTQAPLPVGYKMSYSDAWCAGTVSAAAVACKATDIIPCECSCSRMVALAKKMGIWVENDAYVPSPGDIIHYDWQDSGTGDNANAPDHVGVVEKVVGKTITVIEGNYFNSVKRRYMTVNGKYIRGYIVPKYTDGAQTVQPEEPEVKVEEYVPTVRQWQKAAIADGFKFPEYGADGVWGKECESVAKKAIVKKRLTGYKYKYLTKIVQQVVGVKVDGKCGRMTREAIKEYQSKHGLTPDGAVGIKTWKKILKVK